MTLEEEIWQYLENCRKDGIPVSPDVQELVDVMEELFEETQSRPGEIHPDVK